MIVSPFVFAILLSCAFFLLSIALFIHHQLLDSSYFAVRTARHRARAKPIAKTSPPDIRLSIIYKPKSKCLVIPDQLFCLAALVRENFGTDYPFEIVCVVSPHHQAACHHVSFAATKLSFVVPVFSETKGIRWLVNGVIVSRGQMIIDARFLASQFDSLKSTLAHPVIVFAQPNQPASAIPPRSLSIPIIFPREAGAALFSRLHFLSYGYQAELHSLVRGIRLEAVLVRDRFGRTEYSTAEVWAVRFFEFLVRKMVRLGLWNHDFRQ
jgi:hypothetical protein